MRAHRHRSWSPLGQCVLQLGSDSSGSGMIPGGHAPRPPRPTDFLAASAFASTSPGNPASGDVMRDGPLRSIQQCARKCDEVSNFASHLRGTWPLVGLTTCAYRDQSLWAALSARLPVAHGGAPDVIKTAHDAEDQNNHHPALSTTAAPSLHIPLYQLIIHDVLRTSYCCPPRRSRRHHRSRRLHHPPLRRLGFWFGLGRFLQYRTNPVLQPDL